MVLWNDSEIRCSTEERAILELSPAMKERVYFPQYTTYPYLGTVPHLLT